MATWLEFRRVFFQSLWSNPANDPIRTPSTLGSPIVVFASLALNAFWTSPTSSEGTKIRLIAVHFCPALTVISLLTSLIKISNSGVPGTASAPRTDAFKESASRLNGTELLMMFG